MKITAAPPRITPDAPATSSPRTAPQTDQLDTQNMRRSTGQADLFEAVSTRASGYVKGPAGPGPGPGIVEPPEKKTIPATKE